MHASRWWAIAIDIGLRDLVDASLYRLNKKYSQHDRPLEQFTREAEVGLGDRPPTSTFRGVFSCFSSRLHACLFILFCFYT